MKLLIYKNIIFVIFCLLLVLTILLNSCQSCVEDDLGGNGGGGGGANGDGTPVFEESAYVTGTLDSTAIGTAIDNTPDYIPDPRPLPSETIYEDISVVSIILRSDLLTRSDFFKESEITDDVYASIAPLDSDYNFSLEVPVGEDFFMFVVAKNSEQEATYFKLASGAVSSSTALGVIKYQTPADANGVKKLQSTLRIEEINYTLNLGILAYDKEGLFFSSSEEITITLADKRAILIDGEATETISTISMEAGKETTFPITFYNPVTETTAENIIYSMYYSKLYNEENKPDFCTLSDNNDSTATLVCNPASGDEGFYQLALTIKASFVADNEKDDVSAYLSLLVDPETSTEDGEEEEEANAEKEWTHPESLTIGNQQSRPPQVAMDDNGNAIIVWSQSDGGIVDRIYKSEYRKKADNSWGWEPPEDINDYFSPYTGATASASSPQVAMNNNGNAIIVWLQSDGNYNQVYASHYRKNAVDVWEWMPITATNDSNISPDMTGAYSPQVAMDNNGNAIIVWSQELGGKNYIYKSEYRNGNWVHPSSNDDRFSSAGISSTDPKVAMSDNKDAVIVWIQENAYYDIAMRDYRYSRMNDYNNGNWSNNGYYVSSGSNTRKPQVAMDNNGNAIIVWEQDLISPYDHIHMSKKVGADWVDSFLSEGSVNVGNPQVAMDDNGNVIVVWEQEMTPAIFKIVMKEYRGSTWKYTSSLSDNTTSANYPIVAMDSNGSAIIVWNQRGKDNYTPLIFKSEYRINNGVGSWPITAPDPLNDNISSNGSGTFDQKVAMDNNGNAIIVWNQDDAALIKIYKSEYR